MATNIVYGLGGFCEECDPSHDHPLHNIIEQTEVPDPEPTALGQAIAKLTKLGLTEDEARAIAGGM